MRRTGVLVVILMLAAVACSSGSGGDARAATTTHSIRVVNQNLLHGTACPADSNRCSLPDRVALFMRQLRAAHCPELVAIEEANPQTVAELRKNVPGPCRYHLVSDTDPGQDREVVLTTLTVLGSERRRLAGPLRTALWVRIKAEVGPVDLVATHLASSSDDRPCDAANCPPPCEVADSLNACQGRQAVAFLDEMRGPRSVAVLAGDLNAKPDEPTITAITSAGLVDTHLAAHNPECDTSRGTNCTSGRADDVMTDMLDNGRQHERIDYILVIPNRRCTVSRPSGIFAANGGPIDPADGLMQPSDHSGVQATLRCRTSAADRAASKTVRTSTTTTSAPDAALSPALKQAVTAAFTTLFAPNPDPDAQLAALENAAALRDSFIARKQQVGDLANRTSVRIDSFAGTHGDQTVDVTFSIMIDGNVVLDALPGQAKIVDGHWLVTAKTYCQVATLGIDTIPEACKK